MIKLLMSILIVTNIVLISSVGAVPGGFFGNIHGGGNSETQSSGDSDSFLDKPRPPAEPTVTEPTITEPTISEPTISEPTITKPTITELTITEPTITKPTIIIQPPSSDENSDTHSSGNNDSLLDRPRPPDQADMDDPVDPPPPPDTSCPMPKPCLPSEPCPVPKQCPPNPCGNAEPNYSIGTDESVISEIQSSEDTDLWLDRPSSCPPPTKCPPRRKCPPPPKCPLPRECPPTTLKEYTEPPPPLEYTDTPSRNCRLRFIRMY